MSGRRPEQDDYTPIKLPNSMIRQIDKYMSEHPEYDFKTRPQFVKYIVRRYIEEQQRSLEKIR